MYENPCELNLLVNYNIIKNVDAFVHVRNLTDARYAIKGVTGFAPQESMMLVTGVNCNL